MQKEIKFIVNINGVCLCDGSKRPQLAGVQGDDRICTVKYDLSAVYTDNAKYFVEIVTGNNEPLQFIEDGELVSFDTESKILSILIDNVITQDGGTVEINIVEEVLDSENYTTSEGNTYTSYIYFEPKAKEIIKKKKTLYGMVAEILAKIKNFTQRVSRVESKTEGFEARINKNENDILSHSRKLEVHTSTLDSHSTMLSNYGAQIGNNMGSIATLNSEVENINTSIQNQSKDISVLKQNATKTQMFTFAVGVSVFSVDMLELERPLYITRQTVPDWVAVYVTEEGLQDTIEIYQGMTIQPGITKSGNEYKLRTLKTTSSFDVGDSLIIGIEIDLSLQTDLLLATKLAGITQSYTFVGMDYFNLKLRGKQDKLTTSNIGSGLGIDSKGKPYVIVDESPDSVSNNPLSNKRLQEQFSDVQTDYNNQLDGVRTTFSSFHDNEYAQDKSTYNQQITALFTGKQNKLTVSSTLPSTLAKDTIYSLGVVPTSLTIAFPTITNDYIGSVIYINFECSSAITLTLDTTNTTAIDIIPEANKGYEIFGSWNGTRWVLGYDEYDIPVSTASEE